MSENPKKTKKLIVILLAIVLIALLAYLYLPSNLLVKDDMLTEVPGSNLLVNDDGYKPPTDEDTSTIDTEPESSVDTSTWVRVPEDGYEFMHPGYFIRDNGDHYIVAYEPVVGQEFAAIAIFKPVDMEDPMGMLKDKVDAMVAGEVATVISEPKEVAIDGFKSAYLAEYEVNSGPTTGHNKYYLLQSPYTDKWAAIEYAVHPNTEAIRESFKFMPTQ